MIFGRGLVATVLAVTALLTCACTSCNSNGVGTNGPDGNPDGGTDADSDGDTDTDSLLYDGGPLTDCEGQPEPGEVCVPGGTYLMGCMPYDDWCENNENPMVEVTLSPFWIDKRETKYSEVIAWLNSLGDG